MKRAFAVFPFRARFLGVAMIMMAVPFAYLYFWGGKPEIFNIRTFAIVTTYSETRYFVPIRTNILDELAAILFIGGMVLFSFSKQKNEKQHYEGLRIKAVREALFSTLIIWIISFLLVYGLAIFIFSMLIFVIFLLVYNFLFYYYLYRNGS